MTSYLLGQIHIGLKSISISTVNFDLSKLKPDDKFVVQITTNSNVFDLNLSDIKKLKKVLNDAEKHLINCESKKLAANNLNFNF